ncbi:EamA family transporter [Peribacillus butanolivorans]|uniref:EamA family transporter n=1 Tax=Peribacillus butanolivorans TaxID=421767 RepID=UPI0025AA2327|nr:EamA family transporter [Peribacillus butanolivorans]
MNGKYPYLLVILGAMLWGTTGTAQSFAPDGAHPIVIGSVRLAIGGTALLLIAIWQKKITLHNWPIKETILATLGMACYQPLFFTAVSMTGIAIGTIITLSSAPIIAGFLEWLFGKKRPSPSWWMATGLSIAGCLLLFSNQGSVTIDPVGALFALGAGASFTVYTLVSKKILDKQPPEATAAVIFCFSALLLAPMLFIFDISWIGTTNGLAVSLHLGLLATAVAYLLFNKGLLSVPSSTAVSLSLAEPLTAALLGVFLIGESLTLMSWFGVGLLLCGIISLTISPKLSKSPAIMNQKLSAKK